MKKYLYQRELMAKPATKDEAEDALGIRISNLFYGNDGYLVIRPVTGESNWIPKSVFEKSARLIDSVGDRLRKIKDDANSIADELRLINKHDKPKMEVRSKIYSMTRRIENFIKGCDALISITPEEFKNK